MKAVTPRCVVLQDVFGFMLRRHLEDYAS